MWEDMNQTAQGPATVSRPLGYLFDVLVIGKAAKSFHREMCQRGWVVGPLLDQEASPFFSLQTPRLLEWIFFLIEEDRVRCIFAAPPLSPRSLRLVAPTEEKDPPPCASQALDFWVSRLLAVLLKCRPADVAAVVQVPAEPPSVRPKSGRDSSHCPGLRNRLFSLVLLAPRSRARFVCCRLGAPWLPWKSPACARQSIRGPRVVSPSLSLLPALAWCMLWAPASTENFGQKGLSMSSATFPSMALRGLPHLTLPLPSIGVRTKAGIGRGRCTLTSSRPPPLLGFSCSLPFVGALFALLTCATPMLLAVLLSKDGPRRKGSGTRRDEPRF